MLEVNAIYFILLLEGFALLALILLGWVIFSILRFRGKRRAIGDLEKRLSKGSKEHAAQVETLLQAVYGLDGEDLQNTLRNILQREDEFNQLLLDSLKRGKKGQVDMLDSALARVIDAYKCLQPRADENSAEQEQAVAQVTELRGENEQLRCELSLAKNKMSALIDEFGNMFGGGKDHELALEEIKEKVAAFNDDDQIDVKLQG